MINYASRAITAGLNEAQQIILCYKTCHMTCLRSVSCNVYSGTGAQYCWKVAYVLLRRKPPGHSLSSDVKASSSKQSQRETKVGDPRLCVPSQQSPVRAPPPLSRPRPRRSLRTPRTPPARRGEALGRVCAGSRVSTEHTLQP